MRDSSLADAAALARGDPQNSVPRIVSVASLTGTNSLQPPSDEALDRTRDI